MVCFEVPAYSEMTKVFDRLEEEGIKLEMHPAQKHSILWDTGFRHQIMLAPQCWTDILPGMAFVPTDWDYTLPYGIFFRKDASETVRQFLSFIQTTYTEGNRQGIVPVLDFLAE